MARDQALTQRQRALLAELTSVTVSGSLRWERQLNSAHRYARWKDNMLILGPTDSLDDHPKEYQVVTLIHKIVCS